MKAELTDISPIKKRFEIEVPAEAVSGEIDTITREFAKHARVPGFRPGRAPLGVVKNRYREEILGEMYQHLLPRHFTEAVEAHDFEVADTPQFEEVAYSNGEPLRFSAVFEIYPTLDITEYSDIPLEAVPTEVSEEEADEALENVRDDHAQMTPVEDDREVRKGDFAEISFTATLEGDPEYTPSAEKALCEIGGERTVKEFSENLTGARVGTEREFSVSYRPDYPEPKLAGKTAHYSVRIEAIKEKQLPDLDDDFAQGLGDFKTLDELRSQIREELEERKRSLAGQRKRDALLSWLQDHNDFEVPESLVEHQLQVRLDRLVRDMSRQGINPRRLDVDWGKIRQDQYQQAIRDVRGSLILDHIADREGIAVTEQDLDAEIKKVAGEMGRTSDSVREVLEKNEGLDRLKEQIRNNKVLAMLEERARIVEPAPPQTDVASGSSLKTS
jgi:trigger factor